MSLSCSIRMIYPYSKAPEEPYGHYDLMVTGSFMFFETNYHNPVFSYHRKSNSNEATLYVFDDILSPYVYHGLAPYDLYHYDFSNSDLKCQPQDIELVFLDMIETDPQTVSHKPILNSLGEIKGYVSVYKIISDFALYDLETHNCFKAVAYWIMKLGEPFLLEYANKNQSVAYKAHSIIKNPKILSYWEYQKRIHSGLI